MFTNSRTGRVRTIPLEILFNKTTNPIGTSPIIGADAPQIVASYLEALGKNVTDFDA